MRSAEPISRQAEEALEKQQTVSGILAMIFPLFLRKAEKR